MSRKSTDKLFDGVSSGGSRGRPAPRPPYFGLKKIADGKKAGRASDKNHHSPHPPLCPRSGSGSAKDKQWLKIENNNMDAKQ